MGQGVVKLRRHLGEPEALIRQNQRPLEQVTTGSLEALYRFSQALDFHAQSNIELAIEALEAAVRLDPQFATAHSKLAIYSGGTGSYQRAFRAAEQAYKLRNRVSERERYQISATYHLDCLQYENALKDFQQAVILDSINGDAYRQIAMLHANLGEPHAGIAPARKARDLSPYSVINEGVLILLLAQAGRPDEALRELELARKRFENQTYLYWGEGIAWQVKGDFRRAQRAFQVLAEGGTTYESHGRILLAQSLMLEGRFLQAIDMLEGGLGRDNRQRFERNEAIRSLLLAKAYTLVGDTERAQEYIERVEALPDLPMHIKLLRAAGIHSAEVGDLERARRIMLRLEELRELYPGALSNGVSAQLQGEILAAEGRREEAKRVLKKASILWDDASALRSYARLWLGLGECAEALPSLKKIREERARAFGDFFAVWADGAWAERAILDCQAAGL
jgi:tetratricopeptide (TPR) repeat protein